MKYEGKNIGILGLGKSGYWSAKLAKSLNNNVFVSDSNENINQIFIDDLKMLGIELEIGVVYSITSCIFWSLCVILTKKMVHFDSPFTIITYMYIFMTIITSIFAYYNWTLPDNMTLFLLFLGALCGTIFHLLTNHAYKISELLSLIALDLTTIVALFKFFFE